jgi:uncharacterized protein YecE (DUF72 family)
MRKKPLPVEIQLARPVFPKGLWVGTCHWKYPSWRGLVYSGAPESDLLAEYARLYDTVEIDQWFWSLFKGPKAVLPDPKVAQSYAGAVPDGFKFTVKAPNSITLTHFYKSDEVNPYFLSTDLWNKFIDRIGPILESTATVMLQFEYLTLRKMISLQEFLEHVGEFVSKIDRGIPVSLEIRNPAWLNDFYFEYLAKNGLSPVLIQGYYMPDILRILDHFGGRLRNSVVLRLHGGDKKGIELATGEHWDKIVQPRDRELADIAELIRKLLERKIAVYLNVNNHYEGSAPLTISRLAEALRPA